MRKLALWPLLCCGLAACGADDAERSAEDWPAVATEYATDHAAARAALEASLLNPDNGYSTLRLARYTEEAWGALDEWNPRVRPIYVDELGQRAPSPEDEGWAALTMEGALEGDAPLLALGAEAFDRYPLQIVPAFTRVLQRRAQAEEVGLWIDDDGQLGGLVWVDSPGGVFPAVTCATCHSGPDRDGALVSGLANHRLDYGGILDVAAGGGTDMGTWGRARVDVTSDELVNPAAVPDLRPIRHQRTLHRAATLYNAPMALMVRIETLIITSMRQSVRPPKAASAALARYLWSLGDALPPIPEGPGRAIFERTCAPCHAGPEMSGEGVATEAIGTPDAVARSSARGTGMWRIPSLRGVGHRRPLLASGEVRDVEHLLDPERAVPGHPFGLDLPAEERASLLAFLRAL